MEQRNLILAFALSMLILLGWGMLFPPPENAGPTVNREASTAVEVTDESVPAPEMRPESEDVAPSAPDEPASPELKKTATIGSVVAFGNDLLQLGVNEKGWIVSARLNQYREGLEKGAALVSVLGANEPHATYLNAGLMGEKRTSPFKLLSKESVDGADRVVIRATLSDGR
ncbi:MAG: hypothetical protein GQ467_03885 [Mariprofundaceae bacterium]|nr:hypothetical protein [Mariprofundaceae bacterium]